MPRILNFNQAQTAQAQTAQAQTAQTQTAQAQTAQAQTAQTQPVQTAAQTPLTDARQLQLCENEISGIDAQTSRLNRRRGELEAQCAALRIKLDAARKKEVEDLIKKVASKMGKTETEIRNLVESLVNTGIDEISTLRGWLSGT